MPPILSREDIVKANELYADGLSMNQLAKMFHIHRTTILPYITNKRPPYRVQLEKVDIVEINRLYDTCLYSLREIAEIYGCTRPTIRKHIKNPRPPYVRPKRSVLK